ncbi:MAG: cytochrome c oxidase subunit 3 [Planctomycetota bacterium]
MRTKNPGLMPWQQEKNHELPVGSGTFGLLLFFVSLSVLFVSAVIGVVVVKLQFPDPEFPVRFPGVGWQGSTVCLILVSALVHAAVRAVQVDEERRFRVLLLGSLLAACGYLVFQTIFWNALFAQSDALARSVESGFYALAMLTALHALHVLGGMTFHGLVLFRAARRRYWSLQHGEVRALGLYWHFIDGVWLILLGFLVWLAR